MTIYVSHNAKIYMTDKICKQCINIGKRIYLLHHMKTHEFQFDATIIVVILLFMSINFQILLCSTLRKISIKAKQLDSFEKPELNYC